MPHPNFQEIHNRYKVPVRDLENLWNKSIRNAKASIKDPTKREDFWKLQSRLFQKSLRFITGNYKDKLIYKTHPIIGKVHDITGIPESILEKYWNTINEAVDSSCNSDNKIKLRQFQNKMDTLGAKYHDTLAPLFYNAIYSDAKIKPPTQTSLPIGINPEAIGYWRNVIKNYKKTINEYKDPMEKWAAAIILFKNACRKNGIAPFTDSEVTKTPTKTPVTTFLSAYVNPCLDIIKKIEKILASKNFIGKRLAKNFSFDRVETEGTTKIIISSKTIRLLKPENAGSIAVYLIPKFGFRKGERGTFRKPCGPNATVVLSYSAKSDTIIKLSIELKIRIKMWNSLDQLKKDPNKYLKTWVSKGFKATGEYEDFETEKSVNELVRETYPITSYEDAVKLINEMDLPNIVEKGEEDFQIELARYVMDIAKRYELYPPSLLDKFIESEMFREYIIEQYRLDFPDAYETEGEPEGKITGTNN